MVSTKVEALDEIVSRICGCFGSVDLTFAIHGPDKETAKLLKKIAKHWRLERTQIEAAIEPKIRDWLETGYWGFSDKEPRAYGDSDFERRLKISKMVNEAALYLAHQ